MLNISNVINRVLDFIYPPKCLSCYHIVHENNSLCPECWQKVHFITKPYCNKCGFPFEFSIDGEVLCASCLKDERVFDICRSAIMYDDVGMKLVINYKFRDKLYLLDIFSKWLLKIDKNILQEIDIVTNVPLHKIRLIKRRFNQSALMAKKVAKSSQKIFIPDLMVRKRNTIQQTRLGKKQRQVNVEGAFKINPNFRNMIKGKNILLIDDVYTTGATVSACSKLLKKSGASKVNIYTIARAL